MGENAPTSWQNWAGTYSVDPVRIVHPRSPEQVAAEVCRAAEDNLSVKALGSGHSFTDIAVTRGVMIALDQLRGIISADRHTGLVTVAAGTTLRELNDSLWKMGLSLSNLGDIDAQTISGAICTGTHGTGRSFGGLATQVRGLQLVTATGELLECSAERDPELFNAARISLGGLGIITAVTLQCEPAFVLHAVEAPADFDDLLEVIGVLEHHDHFEFYWFPHTRRVLTKINTRLPIETELSPVGRFKGWLDDEFLSNTVFGAVNRLTAKRPKLIRGANQIAVRALSKREYTDRSYKVFTSSRRVVFREMEYAVPRKSLAYVLDEIEGWFRHSDERIGFPIEVRFAAPDTIPLSTAYGRDTCYIAVHQYHRRPHERYFAAVEDIAREVQGRPHWGKLHYRAADELAEVYPRFGDFLSLRDRLDPDRRFGNDYLRRVLGS
ncbi:MAG: FAD-binding protein [Actinomycetota bacterium]|nr:FAD-binding protein [Actinomycetota bacterium]MDQ2957086.1 FAD-binding protein [Actinomycetota bacterium]